MAVISAGTSGGPFARQMMVQTLTWQGAHVVAESDRRARTKSDATVASPIPTIDDLAVTVLWAPRR